VTAARQLGLRRTFKANLTLEEVKREVELGRFPIAYIRARLKNLAKPQEHAVVCSLLQKARFDSTIRCRAQSNNRWRYSSKNGPQ
jgi:hypothetical protein